MPTETVSAGDPNGIVTAMRFAGFEAELQTDEIGDPKIETDFGTGLGYIYFYGCDEGTNTGCDSVQFVAGLDRDTPMPFSMISDLVKQKRFVAISLDDEGDPWMSWDVITDDGIPTTVFIKALRLYADVLGDVADVVFAEDSEQESYDNTNTAP
ncbi:MAG: YbjN domain-containing protein [Pontixanthobacter sp.]